MIKEDIKNSDRYITKPDFSKQDIKDSINFIIKKMDENLDIFTDKFPAAASKDLVYPAIDNTCWTSSFWTGMLWLAYEYTNDEKYKDIAMKQVKSFRERLKSVELTSLHDLGFLYSLSCVAAYKITGDEFAKETALMAADRLMDRYLPIAGIIQAWGDMNNPEQQGRMIIDCCMNLPLLYWATEMTGDQKYRDAAESHVRMSAKYIVREDSSTYHTFYMDIETGEPKFGRTWQGYLDNSCWSRGQAWAIYGFPLSYGYIKDEKILGLTDYVTNYYLNRLPEDEVCYWDLIFTEGDVPRDSSSAAITACGLLEYDKYIKDGDPKKEIYKNAAIKMVKSLSENYTTVMEPKSNGILLHAVYAMPQKNGVDECNIWGDYYYFEALMRLERDWNMYW